MKRVLCLILGSVTLVLGAVGVFIPILPTTPFLLLTAFFFLRSSARLYDWLMNHRIFGPYIYQYVKHRAIERKTKIYALTSLWITMIIAILIAPLPAVRIMLFVIACCVTLHVGLLREVREEDRQEYREVYREFKRI